jgi:hypothetical protein
MNDLDILFGKDVKSMWHGPTRKTTLTYIDECVPLKQVHIEIY